jgi:hypothetical protein
MGARPLSTIHHEAMAHAKSRWLWGILAFVVLTPGAIYVLQALPRGGATPTPSRPTANPSPTATINVVPTQMIEGFIAPATYWQACYFEASVCNPNDPALPSAQSPLPAALQRPLRLPVIKPGQGCPISAASQVDTPSFGGVALGAGPIRLLSPGLVDVSAVSSPSGWYSPAATTIWFSEPSYQGPWILRGGQLNGASPVIFGNPPAMTISLVVPPVDTINISAGYRWVPQGIYVRGPGCYAVQVDGLSFSYDIVFQAATGKA